MKIRYFFVAFFLVLFLSAICFAGEKVWESWELPVNQVVYYDRNDSGSFSVSEHKVVVTETCGHDCRWYQFLEFDLPEILDPTFIYRVHIFGCTYSGDSLAPEVGIQFKNPESPYEVRAQDTVYWEGDIALDLSPDGGASGDRLSILFAEQTGEYSFDRVVLEKVDTVEAATVRGDCDGDGRLTPADAACILQILSGARR